MFQLAQSENGIDDRGVDFDERHPYQGVKNVHPLMVDNVHDFVKGKRIFRLNQGRVQRPRILDEIRNGLSGCFKVLRQRLHELVHVFLYDQRDLDQRHAQLIDQIDRSLGQGNQAVDGLVRHDEFPHCFESASMNCQPYEFH